MVGGRPPSEPEVNSHALMSLLREGGQWNGEDDIRAGHERTESRAFESGMWDEILKKTS